MAGQDYIIRHIQMVGQFVAQMRNARMSDEDDQAILIGVQAIETLFGMGMDRISAHSLDAQCGLLAKGLDEGTGRDRQFGYALLLRELGISYQGRSLQEIASASFKASLWICLRLMVGAVPIDDSVVALAREMLEVLPAEAIDAPLLEHLDLVADRLRLAGGA